MWVWVVVGDWQEWARPARSAAHGQEIRPTGKGHKQRWDIIRSSLWKDSSDCKLKMMAKRMARVEVGASV